MTTAVTSVAGMPMAHAQNSPSPMQTAPAAAQRDFNIPAQALTAALVQFGQQSGQQVTANGDLVRGLSARTVQGRMTPGRALTQLLAGTGLTYTTASGGTLVLQRSAPQTAEGSMTLPPVQVEGQTQNAQNPYGPGVGYVATQSTTGTKTDTPLIDTPQTISVVTKQAMDDFGAQTVGQALNYTAGVQNQPYGFDPRYTQLLIRGFSATQFGNYRDGLRFGNGSFAYFYNEPYELERIEVFQGPTSVLYGSNNPGGLVNSVSKMPSAAPTREVEMTLGNYSDYQGQFDIGGTVDDSDKVLYRIIGLARNSDTQVPDTKNNRLAVAPSVTVQLSPRTTLTLMAEYQKNKNPMWPYYLYIPGQGLTHVTLSDPSFNDMDQQQWWFGYRLKHEVNNAITLRQNFRFGRVNFYGGFVDADTLTGTTLTRYSGLWKEGLSNADLDNQAQFRFDTGPVSHTILTGIDYFQQTFDSSLGMGTAPSIDIDDPVYSDGPVSILSTVYDVHQTLSQIGFYGQEQLVYKHWHFIFGGREDVVHSSSTNLLTTITTTSNPSAFTWRAGTLYSFDQGFSPYFTYSTSFLPTSGTSSPANGNSPFVPTTGQQYEGGIKYQPPGSNSYITASLYNLLQQHVLTTDPDNPNYNVQTGEVRSRGVQLQAVASFGHGFSGVASYAYTGAVNTESNTVQGKVPVGVPANQAALFLHYSTPADDLYGFGIGGGVRYIGTTWADAANTQGNDPILAVDAVANKDFGRFRLQLNINNIFNNQVAVCNSGNCTWSLGRVVLGNVKLRW